MRARWPLVALAALAAVLFAGLGVWQVERRAWKLALIDRVEARLVAAPVVAPRTASDADSYTRVRAAGRWVPRAPAYVQAVTDLGPGFWVVAPLTTDRATILVNRGFVPAGMRVAPATGPAIVTGLLRVTEPGGAFLRRNDPRADRWFSRDVAAIAAARRLGAVAPYFIDADARTSSQWPRGGLTMVRFRNNHLVYALTWFALSAMTAWFAWRLARGPRA